MQSLEFTGLNLEFYWIRIYNSGSGSRQSSGFMRIRIHNTEKMCKKAMSSGAVAGAVDSTWKKNFGAWAAPKQAGSETLVRVWF